MSDKETLQVYAEKAAEYAEISDKSTAVDPVLAAFIEQMPDGALVLDLGCGPGASAARMAQAGLRVDAHDPVPEMVAMAQQHTGVSAQVAGFDDLRARARYDGVWANFSLLHAAREDVPGHLAAIRAALKPGGLFHIAVKTGQGAKRDPLGRLYTYFTEDELRRLLADAGFSISDRHEGCDKGLDGRDAEWVALTAHA